MLQQVELILAAAERELGSASKCLAAASSAAAAAGVSCRSTSPDPANPQFHAAAAGGSAAFAASPASVSDDTTQTAVVFTGKAIGLLRQAISTFADDVKNWQDDNRMLRGAASLTSVLTSASTTTTITGATGGAIFARSLTPPVSSSAAILRRSNSNTYHVGGGVGGGGPLPPSFNYSLAPDTAALEQQQLVESLLQEQRRFQQATHVGQIVAMQRAASKVATLALGREVFELWRIFAAERRRRQAAAKAQDEANKENAAETMVNVVAKQQKQLLQLKLFSRWTLSFYRRQYDYANNSLQRRASALTSVVNLTSVLREQLVVRRTVSQCFSLWCSFALRRVSLRGKQHQQQQLLQQQEQKHAHVQRANEKIASVAALGERQLLAAHETIRKALLDASKAHFSDVWKIGRSSGERADVLFQTVKEQNSLLTQQSLQLDAQRRQLVELSASFENQGRSRSAVASTASHQHQQHVEQQQQQQSEQEHFESHSPHHQHHHYYPQQLQQQQRQHHFEIVTSAFDGGWQAERLNAFACELLFEAHCAVSDLLLQCSAVMCSCHWSLFRSASSLSSSDYSALSASNIASPLLLSFATDAEKCLKERRGEKQQQQQAMTTTVISKKKQTSGGAVATSVSSSAAAAESSGSSSSGSRTTTTTIINTAALSTPEGISETLHKLQEAYAILLRRNSNLRHDMKSLETVNAGLTAELITCNQDRSLLRRRVADLERALHDASVTEARLRDRCVLAFMLCAAAVTAYTDASEVKAQLWLAAVEELQLDRLLETERQMEDMQKSMMLMDREEQQRSDKKRKQRRRNLQRGIENDDDENEQVALLDLSSQVVSGFSMSNPRHVWQLAAAIRTNCGNNSNDNTNSNRSRHHHSLLADGSSCEPVEEEEEEEEALLVCCRADAVSMLLSAASAFSRWKDSVLGKRKQQRDEMQESADVAHARLETLMQKHSEAMAQLRSMDVSVQTLQRDAKLYQSVVDRLSVADDGAASPSSSSTSWLRVHEHATKAERDTAVRGRCFRRWSTWVAARARQRVYDGATQRNAQESAEHFDAKTKSWAYEVAASAQHAAAAFAVTPLRNAVGDEYVSAAAARNFAFNVELSPMGSPSKYI